MNTSAPRYRTALHAGLVLAVAAPAAAQAPAEGSFYRIPDEAGLSHQTVHAIVQDRLGFLWVGTADGLNRFDGYEFRVYRRGEQDGAAPTENLVWDLLEDSSGQLWVATGGGVLRYNRPSDRFDRIPGPFDRSGLEIFPSRFHESREGRLLMATPGGLIQLEGDAFEPVRSALLDGSGVRDIAEDPTGAIWLLLAEGELLNLATGEKRPSTGTTFALDIDARGRIVSQLDAPGPHAAGRVANRAIWALAESRKGTIWAGTQDGLVPLDHDLRPGPRIRLDHRGADGYVANFVRALFEDRAGTLWVGTHGGLFRYDPNAKPFHHMAGEPRHPGRLSGSTVSAVWSSGDTAWVGTLGAGLNRVVQGSEHIDRYRRDEAGGGGLPSDIVWALDRGPTGRLWVGTAGGLASTRNGGRTFERHPLPQPGPVFGIEPGSGETLWILTHRSVHPVDPTTGRVGAARCCGPPERGAPVLQGFVVTRSGIIWVGENSAGLIRFDPARDEFTRVALDPTESVGALAIWDIHEARDGLLYLGLGTGLGQFDPATGAFVRFGAAQGLPAGVVYSIEEDGAGRLWLGTNQGLTRFDPRSPQSPFRTFGTAESVGLVEFNRRASFRAPDGEMLFGGMGGLTRFDPGLIRDNLVPPPVVMTRIETAGPQGTRVLGPPDDGVLRLLKDERTVDFEFSALSFTSPTLNRYRYRLDGVDEGWVEAGSRRYARYAGLRPGSYTFTVRGSNEDGIWNEDGRSISVEVPPSVWETGWFRSLALAALAMAGLFAYRARVRRLLEIERIRVRIAGDLHDDLASDLSGIALMGESLQGSSRLEPKERARLAVLTTTARRLVGDVRDIVWSVDPGHDRMADLAHHLREVASGILVDMPFTFETEGDEDSGGALSMGTRRQVLLVFKEALHNALRHSEADRVRIRVRWAPSFFRLSVEDDGVGFADDGLHHRFGLDQLGRRARDIGADIRIDSQVGRGTRVILDVPMSPRPWEGSLK
ncbi:MAG: hypothetical protein HKO53_10025 [Gemmatimonadetes bacterium]|nr:hypothetical protein [Gemmatimonadota bacterium]